MSMSSATAIRPCGNRLQFTAGQIARCGFWLALAVAGCSSDSPGGGSVDADGDGFSAEEDCDDSNVDAFPGQTWYTDLDGDGFGDQATQVVGCAPPGVGGVIVGGDCADANPAIHPEALEICDGIDQNCNALIDDGVTGTTRFYADADADGYGNAATSTTGCTAPAGYVTNPNDCDDGDAAYHPGATEDDCSDPNDYNCDGSAGSVDEDGDTYTACVDCDDSDELVNPGATEQCDADDVDEDCDGHADDADDDASGRGQWYADADGDTYGDGASASELCDAPAGGVSNGDDCDDASAAIHPGATEICDAADTDEDCSGAADNLDPNATGTTIGYVDADLDGFGAASDPGTGFCDPQSGVVANADDCDDDALTGAGINPDAAEVCDAANVDEDCDGDADDADSSATGLLDYYEDADGDGYGDVQGTATQACDAPIGSVADHTDCDDSVDSIYPGATEVCDAANDDEDCDGTADDADSNTDASSKVIRYHDGDLDGYGDATKAGSWCDPPASEVADNTDCDDTKSAVNPGAVEVCDAVDTDEDCNALADDADPSVTGRSSWYVDMDSDTYGAIGTAPITACEPQQGRVDRGGDCDDMDASYHPGAAETCGGSNDYNCDGSVGSADADNDGVPACQDCDDSDAARAPGLTEVCDAADTDEDCDNLADDADPDIASRPTWYADVDGDGYGDDADPGTVDCEQPVDTAPVAGDCRDDLVSANPAGSEVCDSGGLIDEDCDGTIDDGDSDVDPSGFTGWYVDADGDAYGAAGSTARAACAAFPNEVSNDDDCVDTVGPGAAIHPGATELTGDGIDQNCDGLELCYLDGDDDGYRPNASDTIASADGDCADADEAVGTDPTTDCNDGDTAVNPGATELAGDQVDQNCDGAELCFLDDDDDGFRPNASATIASTDTDCADADEAVSGDPITDCNDTNAAIKPGATELAADGVDQDCNGGELCFLDEDEDGYRPNATATVASVDMDCTDVHEAVSSDPTTDCNDNDAAIHPGATEVTGDEVDQDCDGAELCYLDDDNDGYRPNASGTIASADTDCADTKEAVGTDPTTDCNDASASVNPGATEVTGDGIDQDCDAVDSCYTDTDNDGYGTSVVIAGLTLSCTTDANRASTADDCDDTDIYVRPGAAELCDGKANNCTTKASWTLASENGTVSSEVAGVWTNVKAAFIAPPYAMPATGTVWVCPGTYVTRITSAGTATLASRAGTLAAAATTILDGNSAGSVMQVTAGAPLIRGLTLTGGTGTSASGTLRGGAVYVTGGDLSVEDSIFIGNTAARGGAIDTTSASDISVIDSVFGGPNNGDGNTATSAGGAISIQNLAATLTMSGTTVQGNTSTQWGGGLSLGTNLEVALTDCELLGNFGLNGGGIFATNDVTLTLVDTDFDGNTAVTGGAGLSIESTVSATASCPATSTVGFTGNTTTLGGGGIHIAGTASLQNLAANPCFMGTSNVSADNNRSGITGNDVSVAAGSTDTADYNGTTAFVCNTTSGCVP